MELILWIYINNNNRDNNVNNNQYFRKLVLDIRFFPSDIFSYKNENELRMKPQTLTQPSARQQSFRLVQIESICRRQIKCYSKCYSCLS